MSVPPIDPRDRLTTRLPTWQTDLAASLLSAAVALSLWVASNPVAGAAVLAVIAGLAAAGRRAVDLGRCLGECEEFAVDLVGDVRVTVSKNAAGTDFANEESAETAQTQTCC